MPRYVCLKTQDGVGCDYTIGCGLNWKFFEADDMEHARQLMEAEVGGYFVEELEYHEKPFESDLKRVEIIEIGDSSVLEISEVEAKINDKWKETRDKKSKAARQAQYEALKKEFGE